MIKVHETLKNVERLSKGLEEDFANLTSKDLTKEDRHEIELEVTSMITKLENWQKKRVNSNAPISRVEKILNSLEFLKTLNVLELSQWKSIELTKLEKKLQECEAIAQRIQK